MFLSSCIWSLELTASFNEKQNSLKFLQPYSYPGDKATYTTKHYAPQSAILKAVVIPDDSDICKDDYI